MRVAPTTPADVDAVGRLWRDGGAAAAARLERQARGDVVYLIAWDGDVPVGHVFLRLHPPSKKAEEFDCAELEGLWVAPQARREGTGRQLLSAAEAAARAAGRPAIGLTVPLWNTAARRLYERQGYRETRFRGVRAGRRRVEENGVAREHVLLGDYLVKRL